MFFYRRKNYKRNFERQKKKKIKKNKIKKNYIGTKSEKKLNNKNESDIILNDYLETEFKDMTFDEVIQREKRLYCEYFEEQLKLNLIIINY